jgi:hypothetical protein
VRTSTDSLLPKACAAELKARQTALGQDQRTIARIAALRQILLAITCAGRLLTAAKQARGAADRIAPNELNALLDVLDAESKRRRRAAKAAVAALGRAPR